MLPVGWCIFGFMPIKRLPPWNAAACAELVAEAFDDARHRSLVVAAAERMVAAIHALNALDPEDHWDLFDGSGLGDAWRVTVENTTTGEVWRAEGKRAGQIAWALDELWQDAPLAMSPVRYQRLAFRILEERAFVPLRAEGAVPEAWDEVVGDLLSLAMGEHRNHYVFTWWQANHGRWR